MFKELWREVKRWSRYCKLKGANITSRTEPAEKVSMADQMYNIICGDDENPDMTREEFRREFAGLTDTSMHRGMNEAMEMKYDDQLGRARSFGQSHRNSRGKQ